MFRTTNSEDGFQKMINSTKQTCAIHKKRETDCVFSFCFRWNACKWRSFVFFWRKLFSW